MEDTQPAAAAPPSSPLADLSKFKLLSEDQRDIFLPAVVEALCMPTAPAAVSLSEAFGLDFMSDEQAGALLFAAKLLVCRVAARSYESDGVAAGLHADLVAAGLPNSAATWLREAAEEAVKPAAADLRLALAHAASAFSNDYLHDFDWSLHYVIGSSALSRVQAPLVALQLQIAKAGSEGTVLKTEALELTPPDLDATLGALAAANDAVRSLPQPDGRRP